MFESICIRSQNNDESAPIDIGFLAEAMLFYQHVRVAGNHIVLKQLVKQCGAETIIALIRNGHLSISYQTGGIGIHTPHTKNSDEIHMPCVFGRILTLPPVSCRARVDPSGYYVWLP